MRFIIEIVFQNPSADRAATDWRSRGSGVKSMNVPDKKRKKEKLIDVVYEYLHLSEFLLLYVAIKFRSATSFWLTFIITKLIMKDEIKRFGI